MPTIYCGVTSCRFCQAVGDSFNLTCTAPQLTINTNIVGVACCYSYQPVSKA